MTTLPNNICELRRLTHFNLSHNKLTSLPKNIGQIDDLEDFDLSENCLTQIPKSFGWFRKLRCLNLKKNSFKTLLPEIFNSTRKFLHLFSVNIG